ncbi:alanine racemase [Candidatus Methylopumilus universalis]|uniref:alanine racemase n=1 Tax=Candidatus Methylopumilus universalis TaxID=2588536 RepID=UPI00111CF440|nr:alanine racemase [Candidatus Methylopumilus universalis]QDC80235.1 alanine racemase [Candidatus Methylopumilus universalis]QDC81537.1 alanine racemase [Candidatus Methylopumilus universalis]QDC87974.1 alanine racemase [Candidatus Methylopumilus universalis]
MRPLKVFVDQTSLRHNFAIVKQLAPKSKIMSVVKANGYGHGLINVAQGLSESDGFAVLNLNEAIDLREHGFEQDILLLEGAFESYEISIAAKMRFNLVVHNLHQLQMIEKLKLNHPIDIHFKINTGMNRLGFNPKEAKDILKFMKKTSYFKSITLMTHFATADEPRGVDWQFDVFNDIANDFDFSRSVANSASIINFKNTHLDWVRPGIMLYGASPIAGRKSSALNLKPAMYLKSKIIALQNLSKDDSVGYGETFKAKNDMRIAVVACGYADGYPRHAPSGTPVYVEGKKTSTVGRVSMDMLYIDVTDIPHASISSDVELWGENIPVDDVAEKAGTVGYELLCAMSASKRVPIEIIHG